MSEFTKESALEEVAATRIAADPTSPLEKDGRREAEDAVEKESADAQKLKVEENKTDYQDALPAKTGHLDSDYAGGSSGLEDDTTASKKTPTIAARNGNVASEKKDETSYDSESSPQDEAGIDKDVAELKKASAAPIDNGPITGVKKKEESSGDLEDKKIDYEEPQNKKIKTLILSKQSSGSEDYSEEKDLSVEKEGKTSKTLTKIDGDVEMISVTKTEENADNGGFLLEMTPETPATPKEQPVESKTVFIGNLSFSIEQADVEEFLQPAGEIVGIRFAMHSDETFRGFGHVEFASAEAAEKAVRELNGKELLRRPVKVDFVREKGSHTSYGSGKDTKSPQKGQTIYIHGFNKQDGIERIRSSLEQHFRSCGEITRVSVPKVYDGGVKGIAYIDFKDDDAFTRALELNGSEFDGNSLLVEPAKPRFGNDNAGGGRWGGRGYGGRFGSGGRCFGGRFGSGGWCFGGRFGSDHGRGRGWW